MSVAVGTQSSVLPTRRLGRTEEMVPILGLGTAPGGFGLDDFQAIDVIHAAIDHGITYLDAAPGYDRAQIQLGEVMPTRRDEVFLVTKAHTADGPKAVEILEQSLRDMRTDAVDLTFVHSVGHLDVDQLLSDQGAFAGLRSAQERGLTRFIGFTAHHLPQKSVGILEAIDVDAVMFAMNFADKHTYDFQGEPLDLAREGDVGVAAMKVYGGAPEQKYDVPTSSLMSQTGQEHEGALHYALGLDGVATAVVGMYTVREIEENIQHAKSWAYSGDAAQKQMEAKGVRLASDWGAHFGDVS